MSSNSTDPLIGRLIDGRYQVRSRIARGGMATVYLATDLRLERRVAIKVMHGHLADDKEYKARFIQEARSAARLAHPNVVNVYDQGQDDDTAYLVMEYLPGITLRELLQEHRVLTTTQALDIMEAILSGLAAAHKNGIVHRDLKPENVLLADDGRIKIGDFGLARAATANTATGNALLGTIAYLSPELVMRGVADTRSDIYAVGIMLYEMLAGEQPFKGEQAFQIAQQHANDTVPTPSSKNPRVPVELDELVLWATARDPDQRPHDARIFLDQVLETRAIMHSDDPNSTATQRTMVLPSAPAASSADAETQILQPRSRHRTGPIVADGVTALATKAEHRKTRGFWIFALVIVLAALAGGTGWYFGAGPGGHVTIPELSGKSPTVATAALRDLGLQVNPKNGSINSPTVPVGAVVATTPKQGSSVVKDSTVTLLVSTGPKLLAYTDVAGLIEHDAIQKIDEEGFTYSESKSTRQFDGKIAQGVVIAAIGADGKSLAGATQYGDKQPISLVVSVGPLPDVTGKSFDDAAAILKDAKLTAAPGRQDYSDTIPKGMVIGIEAPTDSNGNPVAIHPGDTVNLTVSRGKEQVQVPDVTGQSWSQAKPILLAAGFTLDYDHSVDVRFLPGIVTVKSTNPKPGSTVDKGSTIKVRFNGQ